MQALRWALYTVKPENDENISFVVSVVMKCMFMC